VFIGIPRGEELFVSLHPLFTTLHRQTLKKTELSHAVQVRAEGPKVPSPGRVGQNLRKFNKKEVQDRYNRRVKSGEEWVKSARTLFTPRNADKH